MTTTKKRDYSHEHQLRQKRNKRLHADMDRAKVEALQSKLKEDGRTYSNWLEEQMDRAFKEWNLNFVEDETK